MINLSNMSREKALRVEMLLMMLQSSVEDIIEQEQRISESQELPEEIRKKFASNAAWTKETYHLIYGIPYKAE